jgi:glycyl-tRNA synthetase
VTVDHQSIEDGTVTVRDRDSLTQDRVPAADLAGEFARRLRADWKSPKLG